MMLKVLDRHGSFSVASVSPVYENTMATHQPRRSQRHGGVTPLNPTAELAVAQEDRNILQRLTRVGHSATSDSSDESEPQQSSSDSMPVSTTTGAPRRSQRSHKRSRFMDDEYLSSPSICKMASNDDVKVLEQRRNLANEPAAKKRSLKSLSSLETSAKTSPKTAIHSTSPAQKGVNRVMTRRSLGPVVRYPLGTRLNVKYGAVSPQVYEAKVIDVDVSSKLPRYRVHYRGWNKSHDSWITKIDVVSVIEKPSSPTATTSGETVKPPPDITPKMSSKVCLVDCKLSGSYKGSGKVSKDSKTIAAKETDPDANIQGKKRKQDSEEEEEEEKEDGVENGGSVVERQTRSGRKKQLYVNSLPSTTENQDEESSRSSSDGSLIAEEAREPESEESEESEARDETDGSSLESVTEEGIVGATVMSDAPEQDTPEKDGDEGSSQEEDGEKGVSGTEEENGEDDGEKRANDEDNGERDEIGSEDSGSMDDNDDHDDDHDDDDHDDRDEENDEEEDGEEDEEREEDDEEEEDNGAEESSFDSEDQSAARIIPASDCEEAENRLSSPSTEENENLQDETSILSIDLGRSRSDQKLTTIYESISTSESSCESDSLEPVFGNDAKTTAEDFLDEETAHDDVSVSNSNSDDACSELLPAETDSVRSGGTSSIASDHHHRPDSSGNTTTSCSSSQLSQLYDAESTRHFPRIRSSPAFRANFIDLEAELNGLGNAEKEDYILSKMRKIQIEYKHMSSIYNKLTRRSNRASNRKKRRSRRHGNVAVATADTEASPVC